MCFVKARQKASQTVHFRFQEDIYDAICACQEGIFDVDSDV